MIAYNKQIPLLFVVTSASTKNIAMIFDRIKQIKPRRLYLACDLPIKGKEEDYLLQIQELKSYLTWDCRIKTMYNKQYFGYDKIMRKSILWFFRQEPEGIVLDGRTIPTLGVLAFCSVMLEKYRDDDRIGHIAGWNFLNRNQKSMNGSYFFSKIINTTACWASWQRVWKEFDAQIKTLSAFKKQKVIDGIPTHQPFTFQLFNNNYLRNLFEVQYEYINLINNRLTIVPDISYDQLLDENFEWNEIKHPMFITNDTTFDIKFQELKYTLPAITKNVPDGYLYLKNQLLSAQNPTTCKMKIPRIIHQIYEDPAGPPPDLLKLAATWKKKMPDWEYRFWNKQMMQDFLESQFPDFLPYYNSYPFYVQRWDAIRYLILYQIGGLYVDFDYECLEPLDVLLSGQICCIGMEPTMNSRIHRRPLIIGNALMASMPKHSYMAAVIEDMKANFSVNYGNIKSIQIMETTGPFMVTRVYEQFKRKSGITLLPADLVAPLTMNEIWFLRRGLVTKELDEKVEKAFAIHYFFGSWTTQAVNAKQYIK